LGRLFYIVVMRKLLFLDIDGVLVVYKRNEDEELFDPGAMFHLNNICDLVPELEIIISSSWRIGRTIEQLREDFIKGGFKYPERIIDKTPRIFKFRQGQFQAYSSAPRGLEVDEWIHDNCYMMHEGFSYKEELEWREANPFNYVIVDDDGDMLYHQRDHFVQTKANQGLTIQSANRILKILNPSKTTK